MWWLWIVGPIAVAFIYAVTARTDKRRAAEAEKWRAGAHAKRVKAAPGELAAMFLEAGAGTPVGVYEIVPKLAYLGVFENDVGAGSDHQTVVAKLDKPAPTFVARPLPIVEGARAPNDGVAFPKDPELTENVLVEGEAEAAIRKWMRKPVREALLDRPDAWLRVSGKAMAVTIYGAGDADLLDELLVTADAIFAEHGADGAPALLYDDEDDAAPARAKAADEDEGEGEDAPKPKVPVVEVKKGGAAKKAAGGAGAGKG